MEKVFMSPMNKPPLRVKRKRASRRKRKKQKEKTVGGPTTDGVLFPSTRVPKGMNKKTAKKLKKVLHKF